MATQYQDTSGEYMKRFDDADPETFEWVLKQDGTTEYEEFLAWQAEGNTLLPAPPDAEPTPPTPVIVVDAGFLEAVESAATISDIKRAILEAAGRAQATP